MQPELTNGPKSTQHPALDPDKLTLREALALHEQLDRFHDQCGFAVVVGHPRAGFLVRQAADLLKSRGPDGVGLIRSVDGVLQPPFKGLGYPDSAMPPETFPRENFLGTSALVHNRYTTSGGKRAPIAAKLAAVHPICDDPTAPTFAAAYNGTITNHKVLRALFDGEHFQCDSDTEIFVKLYSRTDPQNTPIARVAEVLRQTEGAFSAAFAMGDRTILARDPLGIRPLFIGRFKDGGIAAASETVVLEAMGADLDIEEVQPGEIVEFRNDGEVTRTFYAEDLGSRFCTFELVYFGNILSRYKGVDVSAFRAHAGTLLALKDVKVGVAPGITIDPWSNHQVVVPVLNSGLSYATSYARKVSLSVVTALVRNDDGRAFLQATPEDRLEKLSRKHGALAHSLDGATDVFVVDDSLVRGDTMKVIIHKLREIADPGARIHVRIGSPLAIGPCFYGIDTPTEAELIANRYRLDGICGYIGADSLRYLEYEDLARAYVYARKQGSKGVQGRDATPEEVFSFCDACFSGVYPTRLPHETSTRYPLTLVEPQRASPTRPLMVPRRSRFAVAA